MTHNFDIAIMQCVLLILSLNMAAVMELYRIGGLHLPGILSPSSPRS
jgi:hypothetical protein